MRLNGKLREREREREREMELERVQAIACLSKCMDTIPAEYIRSENEQPAITTVPGVVLEVPVIDLHSGTENEENIIRLVAEAAGEWGLFQVNSVAEPLYIYIFF